MDYSKFRPSLFRQCQRLTQKSNKQPDWQALCRVPLNIVTYLNIQALGLVDSEMKNFSRFSHYKHMADIDNPGRGHFRPQGHGWQDL